MSTATGQYYLTLHNYNNILIQECKFSSVARRGNVVWLLILFSGLFRGVELGPEILYFIFEERKIRF